MCNLRPCECWQFVLENRVWTRNSSPGPLMQLSFLYLFHSLASESINKVRGACVCGHVPLDTARRYSQSPPPSEASQIKQVQFLPLWYVKLTSSVVHSDGELILHRGEAWNSITVVPFFTPNALKSKNLSARPGVLLPHSPPHLLPALLPAALSQMKTQSRDVFPGPLSTMANTLKLLVNTLLSQRGLGPQLENLLGETTFSPYPGSHWRLAEGSLPNPGYFVVIFEPVLQYFPFETLGFFNLSVCHYLHHSNVFID